MGQHDAAPLALAPPEPEQFEQLWREHRVAALALFHADHDTASLDVAFGMARQCGLKQPAARE